MVHTMARLYLSRVLPRDDPKTKPTLQAMVGNNIDRELQYLQGSSAVVIVPLTAQTFWATESSSLAIA